MQSNRYAPRVAGFSFLFLIATVLASGWLWGKVHTANGISDTLASIGENAARVRISLLLSIVAGITTLVLAAMLHAIVAHEDRNLAILALSCRAVEGGLYAVGVLATLALLSLSPDHRGDASSAGVLAGQLIDLRQTSTNIGATFFAAGSTLYSYLLFKARSIPVPLSLTGLIGSLIILVGEPWQTAFGRRASSPPAVIWIPIFVFEISTGVWLLRNGVRKMPDGIAESGHDEPSVAPPARAAG